MTTEQYDRLSILYTDAHRALTEAAGIVVGLNDDVYGNLRTITPAGLTITASLCEWIEQYAPIVARIEAYTA